MSENTELFCAVNAGVNTCGICFGEAYYSIATTQTPHETLPSMELLRCGHGVCEHCLEQMTRRTSANANANASFKCPYCREGGALVANFDFVISLSLQSSGLLCASEKLPFPVKKINTRKEFMEEWENTHFTTLSMKHSKHRFVVLHNQIIQTERERLQKVKNQARKEKEIAAKAGEKRKRACSRNNAVCSACHKDTFNSMKQLEAHMNAKHPAKKIQPKFTKR